MLAAIAGVLRRVQHSLRSRDLRIRRQPRLELVLPVQGEAQAPELERRRLPDRHHPQHRNGRPGWTFEAKSVGRVQGNLVRRDI